MSIREPDGLAADVRLPSLTGDDALVETSTAERHKRIIIIGSRVGILVLLLGGWALGSMRYGPFWLSSPTLVGNRLIAWTADGTLWNNLQVTLGETVLGFLFGATVGFLVGLLLGYFRTLGEIVQPFILVFNSIPKVALAPLFILWLGIEFQMKVVLSATLVFFFVFSNTFSGVVAVERDLIDITRTMGASRRHIMQKVIAPSALVWVFVGLRVSIPYALIGAVVGEIFASNRGVGYLIQRSAGQFDTTGVFSGLIILTALATIFSYVLDRVERFALRWRD